MGSKERGKQVVSSNTFDDPTNTEPSVMELCREAWRIFSKIGNYSLPLQIINEASFLHENSALLHQVRGDICSRISVKHGDRYSTAAMKSAKEATRLSPNSIGFSLFYLTRLITHDLKKALEEGQRALAIKKPIDPATEDYTDPDSDFKTCGERIGFVRRTIHDTITECERLFGIIPKSSKLQKAGPRNKVPLKQISDYPKWNTTWMVSVASNKNVLLSEVLVRETCKEALRIFMTEQSSSLPLKIIQEVCFHNNNSALLHHAQGEIWYQVFLGKDKNLDECKDEYLLKAKKFEKAAAHLSPNSIEFATCYVRILFLSQCYQDALKEGERALAILDPIDPAEDFISNITIDLPDRDKRIGYKRQLLTDFVEACRDILRVNADNTAGVTSKTLEMLLAKPKNTMKQAHSRMVNVELLPNYPNRQLGLSEEERRQKIAALVAIAKIIESFQEDSLEKPESEKLLRYWKSMSGDNKQKMLQMNEDDLFAHLNSKSARKILAEAIAFYKASKSWTFRGCFSCDKKFTTAEEHLAHTVKEHVGSLSTEQKSYLPTELDERWDSVLRDVTWSPLDASAALQILKEKWELWPSVEEERRLGEDRLQWSMKCLLAENAPISNDSQQISALANVQTLLKSLLENECLAAEHVKMVTEYSMNRLKVLPPGSRLGEFGLNQTHLCICFLGSSELTEILKFLEEVSKVSNITDKEIALDKSPKAKTPLADIKERVNLDGESLCLLLDEQFISPSDDSATPNEDAAFESMFEDSSSEEGLQKWAHLETERKQQGKELQQILKKYVNSLKKLCDQKSDLLRLEKAIKDLSLLLNAEFMARKHSSGHVPQSYEAILQKQQEETGEAISEKDRKSRLDVLKQALSADYEPEKSFAVVRTRICKLEIYEDGGSDKPTPFQQVENRIKEAMQRIAKSIGLELMKTDAKIMRTYKENKKLEHGLNDFSGADYRTILLPLVKSYILANLEKQVNVAVEGKSEVAREENQAHVSSETKKRVNEEGNQSKKKGKNKQNKKGKDSKESKANLEKQAHVAVEANSEVAMEEKETHVAPETKKSVSEEGNQSKKKQKRAQNKQNKKGKNAKGSRSSKANQQVHTDCTEHSPSHHVEPTLENTGAVTDVDLKKEEERLQLEEEERMSKEKIKNIRQIEDSYQQNRPVQEHTEDKMVIDVSPQEDPPDISTTTMVNTTGTSNLSDVGEQTQTTAGASIDNVPSAIDETEAASSRCQMVSEVGQQEDIPQLTATTTENNSNTDVGLGQQTQATGGASIANVPVATTTTSSDLVPDDPLKHPALSGVIGLQGCSGGAAAMLLSLRFEAAMKSYDDPSTEPSERPVMYSEPEVDFLAELQRAMRLSKNNTKPRTEDKQDPA